MFCKECGKPIDDDSKYCSHCGIQVNPGNISKIVSEEIHGRTKPDYSSQSRAQGSQGASGGGLSSNQSKRVIGEKEYNSSRDGRSQLSIMIIVLLSIVTSIILYSIGPRQGYGFSFFMGYVIIQVLILSGLPIAISGIISLVVYLLKKRRWNGFSVTTWVLFGIVLIMVFTSNFLT